LENLIFVALGVAGAAITLSLWVAIQTAQQLGQLQRAAAADRSRKPDDGPLQRVAEMLTDASLVWRRLSVESHELRNLALGTSPAFAVNRKGTIDWLLTLPDFCDSSRLEVDSAYQILASENISHAEVQGNSSDVMRFDKEVKSNVPLISQQLDHIRDIHEGRCAAGDRPYRVTLHRPQVMPHFLRKRKKIAELTRRRSRESTRPAPNDAPRPLAES